MAEVRAVWSELVNLILLEFLGGQEARQCSTWEERAGRSRRPSAFPPPARPGTSHVSVSLCDEYELPAGPVRCIAYLYDAIAVDGEAGLHLLAAPETQG
jgi:hypothetical protein